MKIKNENVTGEGTVREAEAKQFILENLAKVLTVNFQEKNTTSYLNLSFLPKGSILIDKLNNKEFKVDNPGNFKIKETYPQLRK